MEITGVKIFPVSDRHVMAYVSIVRDDCFIVRDLKVDIGTASFLLPCPVKK